jgi:hypothetical protein
MSNNSRQRASFCSRYRLARKPLVLSASMNRRKCTRPERSPAIIVRPSGATAQLDTSPSPVKVAISFPLSRSQSRSVRSCEPETARRPSGVTATALTQLVWPSSGRIVWPLSRSQSRSVRSKRSRDGTATVRRHRHTAVTEPVWPSSGRIGVAIGTPGRR